MNNKLINKSKELSYLLRHKPGELQIDKYGYIKTDDILNKVGISLTELEEIIDKNDKKRFSFNNDNKEKIRANQGHSFKVELNLKKIVPPFILYHGTKKKNLESILKNGIKSMNRNDVHLSSDIETANNVASRRKGDDIILEIKSREMYSDGVDIFISKNGVYLTEFVDKKYIKV